MKTTLAVALLGALGAVSRLSVGMWLAPSDPAQFPWATFVCNCSGSFLLGIWYGYGAGRPTMPKWWKEAIGTGFIGSFTTFSAFSMETVGLIQTGQGATAAGYVTASFLCGMAFAWAGISLTRISGSKVKK